MQKICRTCEGSFDIPQDDIDFLEHVSPVIAGQKYLIPEPTKCPPCRQRHRFMFRNQIALYQRPSYPSGDMIFSMYPESAPFPVMKSEEWFSDCWDPLSYGQELSGNTTFMEQLLRLHRTVPRYAAINTIRTENADYCNNVSDIKNCYLTFNTSNAEDCLYGEGMWGSKDCIENTLTIDSEMCYDCTNCTRCFNLQSSLQCENCSDSYYLGFCRNCRDCFGCVNLRNKQYCLWNEQKTKQEYEAFLQSFNGTSFAQRTVFSEKFQDMLRKHPRPHTIMHQTEDCSGNCILQSRNVTESSSVQYGENLKYCFTIYDHCNDCRDFSFFGRSCEMVYESCNCGININQICFCYMCRNQSSDLYYCISCDACQHCFGCVGLWRKEYCILNRQYTREEYEVLVPRIIEHLRNTPCVESGPGPGPENTSDPSPNPDPPTQWGEFLPLAFNPMPYNRSIAYRYYPLSKEQVLNEGFIWHEEDEKDFPGAIDASSLPDGLLESNDPITVRSALSQHPFRITTQEIERYRQLQTPLPRLTYEERMHERARALGHPEFHEVTCSKTGKTLLSPFSPEEGGILWDRDVYEEEFA